MSEVSWSVDSLIIKDNILFGFGWIFHEKQEITDLRIRLRFLGKDGILEEYISADAGKPREDVEHIFTNQPRSLNSGYVVFGAFNADGKLNSIDLVCLLADGSNLELSVPISSAIQFTNENRAESSRLMLRQFYIFLKRGIHLVRSGKFISLFDKAKRYLKGRPKNNLHNPAELIALFKPEEQENLCLIVDHDLGGGANHYRDRLVDSIIKDGRSIIILAYHVATLSHIVILINNRINLRFSIPDKSFLLNALRNVSLTEIIYNTGVSFAKPEEIPQLLISLKLATSARLKIFVHDFFLICPSHFLLDYEGNYCGIPDINRCSLCLSRNQYGFSTLYRERDMSKWRSLWGGLLVAADEITTFSMNSSKLLRRAYPHIQETKISIIPHKVNYLSGRLPKITDTNNLCIGIVGQIGFHKGSLFVQALAHEIKRRNVEVSIVVIGTVEAMCEPSVVKQTGPYHHDNLPELIEKSGVNIFLFPSIWPETFSYVVQELVEMKLPVACFNLGAPAERIMVYPKGMVLDSMDPGVVLDALILFHHKIYSTH